MTKGPLTVAMSVCDNLGQILYNWQAAGVGPRVYDGPGCGGGINHAVILTGWTTVPDSRGVSTPAWILRNEWGAGWAWQGEFYAGIATASATDGSVNGAISLSQPVGLAFVAPPARRELHAEHERQMAAVVSHSARVLQLLEENPPAPTGIVYNCSDDPVLLARAAGVAKTVMDGALSASCATCGAMSYTAFAVHVLECQSVGAGKIYKASVSALNPISGARDAGHVTFYNSLYQTTEVVQVDVNGEPLPPPTDDDGYVAPYAAPQPGAAAANKGTGFRALQAAGTSASGSAKGGGSTAVLDAVIVPGDASSGTSAAVPGSSAAPLTNPIAVVDVFGIVLSSRAQLLLVQSAVIIVGTGLLAVICTAF